MWPNALAHAIPFSHSAQSDPYIVLALTTIGVAGAILTGVLVGNYAIAHPGPARAATALAVGALVFLLFDLFKETASLGQSLLSRPLLQAGLVGAYAAGLVLLAHAANGGPPVRVAWAWALGIAAHGAGEAWIVGTEALTADITAPAQAASFLLHKAAEGATIPLVAGTPLLRDTITQATAGIALVALLAGAFGFALGPSIAPMVLFAAGAGAATFAALALSRRMPLDARNTALVATGVALIWMAGVLHEI